MVLYELNEFSSSLEPPFATVKLLANALDVPPPYMYCKEQDIADILLALHKISQLFDGRIFRLHLIILSVFYKLIK